MDFGRVMRDGARTVAFYLVTAVVAAVLMILVLILLGLLQV